MKYAAEFAFTDRELHDAVEAYGIDTMRGQLAAHCLELRHELREITDIAPGPDAARRLISRQIFALNLLGMRS